MHNTSSIWTAVTKLTQTQKPSQTNTFSTFQCRVEGGFVLGNWDLSIGERSQALGTYASEPSLVEIVLGQIGHRGKVMLGRGQCRYVRKHRCVPEMEQ